MAKQKQPDKSPWARFQLWVKQNEKVLFVVLLAVLAFTFAFGDAVTSVFSGGRQQLSLGFGRQIDDMDLKVQKDRINRTLRLARINDEIFLRARSFVLQLRTVGQADDQIARLLGMPPEDVLRLTRLRLAHGTLPATVLTLPQTATISERDALELLFYKGVARDLNLRVSDRELEVSVRRLYQGIVARNETDKRLSSQGVNPQQAFQRRFDELDLVRRTLEREDVFELDEYNQIVKNVTGLKVKVFEEVLRDLLLVSKLGVYVTSTAVVSPKEIYEQFLEDFEKRKLRWTEIAITDELREAVRGGLTEEEIQAEYDLVVSRFNRNTPRLRFSWLRADRAALTKKVEEGATEEKLLASYEEDRGRYVAPGIFPQDAGFSLLTAEQKAERNKTRYKPFEEVKDEVRRRYIKEKSNAELRNLGTQLSTRLYPTTPVKSKNRKINATASDFSSLVEEWKGKNIELLSGETDYATEDDAEEVFGDLYVGEVKRDIDRWYTNAAKNGYKLSDTDAKKLRYPTYLRVVDDDEDSDLFVSKYCVFFTDVELRGGRRPKLPIVRREIVNSLVSQKVNEILATAAEQKIEAIQSDSTKFDDLPKASIEVEAGGKTFAVVFGDVKDSGSQYVQRAKPGEIPEVMVPAEGEEEGGSEESNSNKPPEVAHESSGSLHDAVFSLGAPGEVVTAWNDEKGAFFVVEYVDFVAPDPGGFKLQRGKVESEMLRDRHNQFFTQWKKRIYVDAGLGPIRSDSEAAGG